MDKRIEGTAAGVPFVALGPAEGAAPLVVTWHLMPGSAEQMASALPMGELHAWKVHFDLPMFGKRQLEGGFAEFFRLASEDNVLNVVEPVTEQAAAEFPAAVEELRKRLSISDGPVGVVGGSAGGAVAYEVLTRAEVDIAAGALVNPVTQLPPVVAANERRFEVTYTWTEASRAVADRYDFVRRAGEFKHDLLLVIGEDDDISITEPAAALHSALTDAELVLVPGLAHEVYDEAGAPTASAGAVDKLLTEWFQRHL
ncbi:Prolyl oligopeptidase family protein [Amycolatopsis xylanica]|uniref:Prolyl oligopeptidase family protein n=1 Tax=Amycolatopsis xylanica TaxID=589385 RepID=A0A1H3S197_9PSEU|nr:prolyl oligopeptidase family serine peptidase [Amycolatopsis xylanica]SDZ31776.1 Prolyl oligopeptidase family protein [Amycolatopsis xylanica]